MTLSPATPSSPDLLGHHNIAGQTETDTKLIGGGRILGIDPGPEKTALVLWDGAKVLQAEIVPSEGVIGYLLCETGRLTVACEHLQCFGMSVGAEVFETAYWIGEFRRACTELNMP